MFWALFKVHRHLQSLIKEGRVKEALDLLERLPVNQEYVLMLQSRLSDLNEENIRGTSSVSERRIIKNQIVASTIEVINELSVPNNIYFIIRWILKKFFKWGTLLVFGIAIVFFLWFFAKIVTNLFAFTSSSKAMTLPKSEAFSENQTFERKKFYGHDSLGQKADFIIYIIREFDWERNEVIETNKDGIRADVCEHLKSSNLISQINDDNLLAIICFGNASEEEDMNLPDYASRLSKEEDRAYKRAKRLADCLILQKTQPTVYLLNLGKYDKVEYDPHETAYQRQVIIIGIRRMDALVLTDQALRNGLMKEYYGGNLKMNIEMFSRVKLEDAGLPIIHYRN